MNAIQQILKTEEETKELVDTAREHAEKSVTDARADQEQAIREIKESLDDKRNQAIVIAKKEALEESKSRVETGKQKIENITAQAERNVPGAVKHLLDQINK